MKTYKKYLVQEKTKEEKVLDVLTNNYNGRIKRKKLSKLGYSDEEIKFIEDQYRNFIKKYSRDKGVKFKNQSDNFGNIMTAARLFDPSGLNGKIKGHNLNDYIRDKMKKFV